MPVTVAFLGPASSKPQSVYEASIEPGGVQAVTVELANVWEAGESTAKIFDHDREVAVLRAGKYRVPLAVRVLGTGSGAAPARRRPIGTGSRRWTVLHCEPSVCARWTTRPATARPRANPVRMSLVKWMPPQSRAMPASSAWAVRAAASGRKSAARTAAADPE